MQKKTFHTFYLFSTLVFSSFLLATLDIFTGPVNIPFFEVLKSFFNTGSGKLEWTEIIINFRLPKAFTAFFAGAALSVAGLQMQTIFRNPLAGPDVLGISSGASLGVALIVLGSAGLFHIELSGTFGNWAIIVSACLGSGLVLMVISAISLRVRDVVTILILGILFSGITMAIVSILQFISPASTLKAFMVWTMGSLGGVTHQQLFILIPCVMAGLLLAFVMAKISNALQLGEHYARTMGVNIRRSRFLIFFSASILTGCVTAFCGPLGFIGIVVPHVARLMFKTSDQNILIPASILIGGVAMLASDIITCIPVNDASLPINAVTSLLGIPFVIWLVMKNRKIA